MSVQQILASIKAASGSSEPNPYVWYTFDNTLADAMGNNSNATRGAGGAYTTGNNGYGGSGEATVFNGNSNSMVTIPSKNWAPQPTGQAAYTIEFAVFPTTDAGVNDTGLVSNTYLATQAFGALWFRPSTRRVLYYGNGGTLLITSSSSLAYDSWARVRFIHEDGVLDRLYFDTGSGFVAAGTASTLWSNNQIAMTIALSVGNTQFNTAFRGRIDELKIWREAVIPS